jgi:hypothetical protein
MEIAERPPSRGAGLSDRTTEAAATVRQAMEKVAGKGKGRITSLPRTLATSLRPYHAEPTIAARIIC